MVVSPRANSSYEGRRLEVRVEFTGPVDERSNKIYFLYTSNPDISSILPRKQLVTLVTHCLILCNYITNSVISLFYVGFYLYVCIVYFASDKVFIKEFYYYYYYYKLNSGWGSAPDPARELTALPRLSWI